MVNYTTQKLFLSVFMFLTHGTPFFAATSAPQHEDPQQIVALYTLPDSHQKTILHTLIDQNLVDRFIPFLSKGAELGKIHDAQGNNLLHYALIQGRKTISLGLIEYNCVDFYEKNHLGFTSLDYALAGGDPTTIQRLSEKMASILEFHIIAGNVIFLLHKNLKHIHDGDGNNALHLAVKHKQEAIALEIIKNHPNVSALQNNKFGINPSKMIITWGNIKVINALKSCNRKIINKLAYWNLLQRSRIPSGSRERAS